MATSSDSSCLVKMQLYAEMCSRRAFWDLCDRQVQLRSDPSLQVFAGTRIAGVHTHMSQSQSQPRSENSEEKGKEEEEREWSADVS